MPSSRTTRPWIRSTGDMFIYDPTCHTPSTVTVAGTPPPVVSCACRIIFMPISPASAASWIRLGMSPIWPRNDDGRPCDSRYCWLERYIRPQSLNGLGMRIDPRSVAHELAELLSDGHRLAHPLHPAVERRLGIRRVPPSLLGQGDHACLVVDAAGLGVTGEFGVVL